LWHFWSYLTGIRQWLLPRRPTCAGTNSILDVHIVFKIKYRFLKVFKLRLYEFEKRAQLYIRQTLQSTRTFLVPPVQFIRFIARHVRYTHIPTLGRDIALTIQLRAYTRINPGLERPTIKI
jgi:hypothetical protein